MISTPFWYKSPSILYEHDYIYEFFPSRRFDIVRKLNACLRLSLIYSLVMYLVMKETIYLYAPLFVAGITWIIWNRLVDTQIDDIFQ